MHCRQVITLATYNTWINKRLYASCDELTDHQRKQDRGAYFKSIHGTLNHQLVGDKVWLDRLQTPPVGQRFSVPSLDVELHTDFDELWQARSTLDKDILTWANTLNDEILAGTLAYESIVDGQQRRYDMWLAVTHFFNHQTHHRGQLTTFLTQCNVDYGVTDLIWLPGAEL